MSRAAVKPLPNIVAEPADARAARGWLHLCFENASDRGRVSRATTGVYHEHIGQARPARREVTRR